MRCVSSSRSVESKPVEPGTEQEAEKQSKGENPGQRTRNRCREPEPGSKSRSTGLISQKSAVEKAFRNKEKLKKYSVARKIVFSEFF